MTLECTELYHVVWMSATTHVVNIHWSIVQTCLNVSLYMSTFNLYAMSKQSLTALKHSLYMFKQSVNMSQMRRKRRWAVDVTKKHGPTPQTLTDARPNWSVEMFGMRETRKNDGFLPFPSQDLVFFKWVWCARGCAFRAGPQKSSLA